MECTRFLVLRSFKGRIKTLSALAVFIKNLEVYAPLYCKLLINRHAFVTLVQKLGHVTRDTCYQCQLDASNWQCLEFFFRCCLTHCFQIPTTSKGVPISNDRVPLKR